MLVIETHNRTDQALEIRGTVSLLTIPIPLVPFRVKMMGTIASQLKALSQNTPQSSIIL